MLYPFNRMNVDVSCLGNHELDAGMAKGRELIDKTSCPWILTNLLEIDKQMRPLLGLQPFHVV